MKLQSIEWKGQRITKPGMYSGLTLDDYHAADICDGPSISSSGLRKIFTESPAHFYATWAGNPERVDENAKRHFILGRAVHHLMLGEPNFAKLFAIQPPQYPQAARGALPGKIRMLVPQFIAGKMKDAALIDWSNAATFCKLWNETMREAGKIILLPREVEQIKGMARSLGLHRFVRPPYSVLNGLIEQSLFWKDKQTGIWLKTRPDAIPTDSGEFVDLKTTSSVLWNDIVRTVGEFGYKQQAALICEAAKTVLGIQSPSFALLFVETSAPHCVLGVELKEHEIARGARMNRVALNLFAKCLKDKRWPGPGDDREEFQQIETSERQQKAEDDQLVIMGA